MNIQIEYLLYEWVQNSLNLRKVNIYEFSRLNLIQTVLSKRYLKWFVETGRVEGWDDPRFHTVTRNSQKRTFTPGIKRFLFRTGGFKKNKSYGMG